MFSPHSRLTLLFGTTLMVTTLVNPAVAQNSSGWMEDFIERSQRRQTPTSPQPSARPTQRETPQPSPRQNTTPSQPATPTSQARNYKLPTEIAQIAKQTVVRIEPTIASPGSGVIIGQYQEGGQQVYAVLTAAHVVQHNDDLYDIITPQPLSGGSRREKIRISNRDIERLPNVDLAIVRFRSDRNYAKATLGESDHTTEGAGVYVAGFPNPGEAIRRRIFQFTSSLVSSRLDLDEYAVEGEESPEALDGGYAIVYTNVTRAGMSGGPVFDVAGHLIGIHGMGDAERIDLTTPGSSLAEASSSAAEYIKTGFNLGIPIRTFLSLRPNATRTFNLAIDSSEPGFPPGGYEVAVRGSSGNSDSSSNVDFNIVEEEEIGEEIVVDQTQPNSSNSTEMENTPQTPTTNDTPASNPAPAPSSSPSEPSTTPSSGWGF